MPNWCLNSLRLAHDNPEMIERAVRAAGEGRLLSEFVPCPQALLDTEEIRTFDPVARDEIDAKREANIAEYGYASWYDWCIANWDTKWDVDCHAVKREDANNAFMAFDSAWRPPIAFYEQLEQLGFIVEAYWYEPGMMFCGLREDCVDNHYDIHGDSEWVVNNIPEELNKAMSRSSLVDALKKLADCEDEAE